MKRKIVLCAGLLFSGLRGFTQTCPTSGTVNYNCTTTGDLNITGSTLTLSPGFTMTVTGDLTVQAGGTLIATDAFVNVGSFTDGYNSTNTLTGGTYTVSGDFKTGSGGDFTMDGVTANITGGMDFSGEDIVIANSTVSAASLSSNLSTITFSNSNVTTTGTGGCEFEDATITSSTFSIGGALFVDSGTTTISDSDLDVGVGFADGVSQDALTMNGGGILNLNSNTTMDVRGHVVNNELHINASHVVVTGDFDNFGSEVLEVSNGGSIQVQGDYNNGGSGSTTASDGGTIEVDGDYDNSGGGSTTVDGGGMVVGGTYSGTDPAVTGGDSGCSGGSGGCCGAACASLPVKLLGFNVESKFDHVVLNWTTATELNNDHFNIHRSSNGVDFDIIEWVAGNGTTDEQHRYELKDYPTQKGIYYYQLEQVDYDGKNEFFSIEKVNFNLSQASELEVYPVPLATGDDFYISLSEEKVITASIYDLSGRTNMALPYEEQLGRVKINSSGLGLLPGVYVIRISTELGQYTQKLRLY